MKKTQLTATLQALSHCTPAEETNQLRALAAFIEKRPGTTMAPILKILEAGRKARKTPRRSPAALRNALLTLSSVVRNVGTKGAIGEIDRLAKLLPPDADCSLNDFLADLDALFEKPAKKKVAAKPANEALAQQLVSELSRTKGDAGRFPHLMQTLENTKKVDTSTLRRIGELFLPQQKFAKGRKPVLNAILARHHDELRYAFQEGSLEALRK